MQLPFSIITNLILSSYCDKVGHKLPLILPMVGTALATIFLALLATTKFLVWPMGTVLIYAVLNSGLGGYPLVGIILYKYSLGFLLSLTNGTPVSAAMFL